MHIISFATKESNWSTPRVGFLLHAGDRDTGYRLDCEKLFDKDERPAHPLAWFDMDGRGVKRASQTDAPPHRAQLTPPRGRNKNADSRRAGGLFEVRERGNWSGGAGGAAVDESPG